MDYDLPTPEELPNFLISKDSLKMFIAECNEDKRNGLNTKQVAEGQRVAAGFRTLFPSVSDKDLGTIILTFAQTYALIAETKAMDVSELIKQLAACYSYAGADLMESALAFDEL